MDEFQRVKGGLSKEMLKGCTGGCTIHAAP